MSDIDYDEHYKNIWPPGWIPSEIFYGVIAKDMVRRYLRHNKWYRRLWRWLGRKWRWTCAWVVQRWPADFPDPMEDDNDLVSHS